MYSETCCASLFIVSTYEFDSCLNLFFFSGKIIYLGASVRFCCISVLLAGSEESVGGWSSQWPFRQPTHTHTDERTQQPPVTPSALTCRVKAPLKAPWHPPAPACLFLDAHDTEDTHWFARMHCHTIKPHKTASTSCQPYACGHMPFRCWLSLSLLCYLSSLFSRSHMRTHSVDQSAQIGLMACGPSAD